jgi:hypothetical protein
VRRTQSRSDAVLLDSCSLQKHESKAEYVMATVTHSIDLRQLLVGNLVIGHCGGVSKRKDGNEEGRGG